MSKRLLIILFSLFFAVAPAMAQSVAARMSKASKLHSEYEFESAAAIYDELLKSVTDSALICEIQQKKTLCENGRSMLLFSTRPQVVAQKRVSADYFFLNYSHLNRGSWIKTPNVFAPMSAPATFFENDAKRVIFAAPDEGGKLSLYSSSVQENGLWSVPEVINSCHSEGNETYPLISASGKELYFSSDAMAGMGGYDLYVSRWSERGKRWEAPENLGFPYSSTADDFLFSNTPDGEYTVFASNRGCPKDSVTIYVLRFESSPVKTSVGSASEARDIARLAPVHKTADIVAEPSVEPQAKPLSPLQKSRRDAITRLEDMKDEIKELQAVRGTLIGAREISANESHMMDLQRRVGALSDSISLMDVELIASGVTPDYRQDEPVVVQKPSQKSSAAYSFSRRAFGALPKIEIEKPVDDMAQYEFSISDKSVLMDELPDGVIYQIQVGVSSTKMQARQFKGISPAFSRKQPSGKYLHSVGAFRNFAEASEALSKVKKAGFSSAYVIAFKDGKTIAVSKAKTLE